MGYRPSVAYDYPYRTTHHGFSPRLGEYRSHPTAARYGVEPAEIPRAMREFMRRFTARIDQPDPITLAAWVEFQFDEVIHPISDGCGRVSKALAAWVLTRRRHPLPVYGKRRDYLAAVQGGWRSFLAYYRSVCRRPSETRSSIPYFKAG
ncbi:MAG: Fic family protein [bacterium]|nr:Fic family protein [bacterium]